MDTYISKSVKVKVKVTVLYYSKGKRIAYAQYGPQYNFYDRSLKVMKFNVILVRNDDGKDLASLLHISILPSILYNILHKLKHVLLKDRF